MSKKSSKPIVIFSSTIFIIIFFISCENRDFKVIAKVETKAVNSITAKQAKISGIVIDAGNGLSDFGHCWSKKASPSLTDYKTSLGPANSSVEYFSDLTYLDPGAKYYVRAYGIGGNEIIYGEEVSFTTMNGKAILVTSDITNITLYTATGGGKVTSASGDEILEKGICWDTLSTVSLRKKSGFTQNGIGLGTFSSDLTGLIRGKTYYVKSWAITSIDTTYGELKVFTTLNGVATVTTTIISSITANTAISGGTIGFDGGSPITTKGICWSTTEKPTIIDSRTTDGSGTGSFTSNMTELEAGRLYYVRAFATNSITTSYGNQLSFTTKDGNAILTTMQISQITATTAMSGGNITNDGGSPIASKGVCWSTSPNPTIINSKTTAGLGNGPFESIITGLMPGQTYYLRAYVTNTVKTSYGDEKIFVTKSGIATITTKSASKILAFSAMSGGNITDDGGAKITAFGVCFSTNQNPTIFDFKTEDGSGTGDYVSLLSGLIANTTYYFRAYATNIAGTSYGSQLSLTTCPIPLYKIGQIYQGGIVFYVDCTGQHGLVCTQNDISTNGNGAYYNWDYGEIDGYYGWYMPKLDEVSLIYQNLKLKGIGNLTDRPYWCGSLPESCYGIQCALVMNFIDGRVYSQNVGWPYPTRLIHGF
ncbi:MAG: hypothetical protein ACM3RX_01510 [Methanococcaceae archaeon]